MARNGKCDRSIRGSQMVAKMEIGPAWEDMGFVFTK
jgi:hypothetical protein